MARLADILKGTGPGPVAPGAAGAGSRRLADVVRHDAEPAAQAVASDSPPAASVRRAPSSLPGGGTEAPLLRELEAATQVLQQAVDGVEELLQAVAHNAPFSIARAEYAVELLLQSLERGDTLLLPFFTVGAASTSPARKAVNVCILSVKMGMELGYVPEELQRLGVAALLCDAGIAPQLSRKPGPRQWLAEVAERRHRKAADPRRPGDRLDECAAIIRLADTYETLVHSRPFRHPIGQLEALREILQRERTSFPDGILKALIRALSAFPVGSLVRLNTGEIGRVVARNADFPLRPVVEVLVRGARWLEAPAVVDLSQNPLQHIQDSVAEEALP